MNVEISTRQIRVLIMMVATVLVIMLTLIGFVIWASASGRSVSHNDIDQRLEMLEDQFLYVSCLLVIPPEDRGDDPVATCWPDGTNP